jgi:hypothetical protein
MQTLHDAIVVFIKTNDSICFGILFAKLMTELEVNGNKQSLIHFKRKSEKGIFTTPVLSKSIGIF